MNATRAARALFAGLFSVCTLAAAAPEAPPVSVGRATLAPITEEVPLTGTVTSPRRAEVSPSVSGLVEEVRVEVGDRVRAGDVLITLDRELERLTLEAARAATEQARAELADARRRLAEARELTAQQTIPMTELHSLEAQVQISAAAVARLEAEEKRQAARLRRHALTAPFAGVISRRLAEAGEWVEPGGAVVELIATDGLRIDFPVPQRFFPRIGNDTRLQVRLAAAPDKPLEARIGTVVPVNDPSARTFLLRAYIEQAGVPMTPGMSARGILRLDTDRQGVVVPRDALLRYPDGRVTVWVVEGDGPTATVSERQVQTGMGFDGKVEIRAGLEPGARVVLAGNEALEDGQTVRVASAE